jgi:hypothetical protein
MASSYAPNCGAGIRICRFKWKQHDALRIGWLDSRDHLAVLEDLKEAGRISAAGGVGFFSDERLVKKIFMSFPSLVAHSVPRLKCS